MSAATTFPEIKSATLQNLAYAILTSTRSTNGTAATGFKDRLGNAVVLNSALSGNVAGGPPASMAGPGREVQIIIRINPDGVTATAKVIAQTPLGAQAVEGQLDTSLLTGTTL